MFCSPQIAANSGKLRRWSGLAPMASVDEGGPRQFVTGWKAIAGHLGVDKSTAQRWVKTRGLPIKPDDPMNRSLKI